MDSYMALNESRFMSTWVVFENHLLEFLEEGLTQSRRPWHSERSQPLIYSILSCVRTHMNRNSLKHHLVEDPATYDFKLHLRVRDRTTWFWKWLGTACGLFLGSHSYMVTALGLVCEVDAFNDVQAASNWWTELNREAFLAIWEAMKYLFLVNFCKIPTSKPN